MADPIFFASPQEFRAWLEDNHDAEQEVVVGFYRRDSGKTGMTWAESVDEALCFGWIDGVRHRRDEESYTNRFTPRKPRSHWSSVNVKRVEELLRQERMRPAGLAAFSRRREDDTALASYEDNRRDLDAVSEEQLRASARAWAFFESQAPHYQRAAAHWVMSAKREETRRRRLETLIDDSERGRRIGPMRRNTQ